MKSSFREIFDDAVKKTPLKVPEHFDMVIDSFLIGNILFYSKSFYDGNIFDVKTQREVLEYVYRSNIQKIITVAVKPETIPYTHPYGLFHDDVMRKIIADDYMAIAYDPKKAVRLIQAIIDDTINELTIVTNSYKAFIENTGKKERPVEFFINCFVHPLPSVNYFSEFYTSFEDEMKRYASPIFEELMREIPKFLDEFLDEIGIK